MVHAADTVYTTVRTDTDWKINNWQQIGCLKYTEAIDYVEIQFMVGNY